MTSATEPTRNGGASRSRCRTRCVQEPDLWLQSQLGRDLIPGHHLGAITLADTLDQGPPRNKLLCKGRRRLDKRGVASRVSPAQRSSSRRHGLQAL